MGPEPFNPPPPFDPAAPPPPPPPPPAGPDLAGADAEALAQFRQEEADRKARAEADRQAISDVELASFKVWQAQRKAEEEAQAEALRVAEEARVADERLAAARAAEDRALCPTCEAPRNNPDHAGHPHQEYLPYCWKCGHGANTSADSAGNRLQPYPVLTAKAS